MRKLFLMLMMIALSNVARAGTEVGNGGGGVRRDGVYMTFYSAGMYVSPIEEETIPGMESYIATVNLISLNQYYRTKLLAAGLPNSERHFYRVLESKFDKKTLERLTAEYARISGQPPESLALFAITDIAKQTTYLLPSFYQLNTDEQAAILFHEAYWILDSRASNLERATYLEVVQAETAFQEFMDASRRDVYASNLGRILGKIFKDSSIAVLAALDFDLRHGMLSALGANQNGLPMKALGYSCPMTFYEVKKPRGSSSGADQYDYSYYVERCFYKLDGSYAGALFKELSLKHPGSAFLKEMAFFLLAGKVEILSWTYLERDKNEVRVSSKSEAQAIVERSKGVMIYLNPSNNLTAEGQFWTQAIIEGVRK